MEQSVGVSRRDVLRGLTRVIATAVLARWSVARGGRAAPSPSGIKVPVPAIAAAGTAKLRFFSPEEKEVIATVADIIIPCDEVSAGARAAGVPEWIDFVVANSPDGVQQQWREGLGALDRLCVESAGRKFLELKREGQQRLLEQLAEREFAPGTPAERFFALAKEATVNGYYTSEIGLMKDLRYQGGTFVNGPETSCTGQAARPLGPREEISKQ